MSRIRLLAAAALLAAGFPLAAGEPVQKVYGVADFVVPCGSVAAGEEECDVPGCCAQAAIWAPGFAHAQKTEETKLIKLITSTVRPKCWKENGGPCSVEYFPIGMGLVVHAPAEVQKEVSDLLDSLRKKQDTTVCVTLRFVTVRESFFERIGVDFAQCEPGKTVSTGQYGVPRVGSVLNCPDSDCAAGEPGRTMTLTAEQVKLFLAAVEGDPSAKIMSAPRLSLFDGQTGTIACQDRQQYVTGVNVKMVDGKQQVVPETTSHATGIKTTVTGRVSADKKFVAVNLNLGYTYLESADVPLFPVTYTIEPQFADGNKGQPIPFTQFIQQPKFGVIAVDTQMKIPCGGTMLIHGGKFPTTACVERSVPVLAKIPYVNRLFKHAETVHECHQLLVLVTPTVEGCPCDACPPACAGCPACPACPSGKTVATASAHCGHEVCLGSLVFPAEKSCTAQSCPVVKPCTATESRTAGVAAKLVKKYHDACAAGRPDEAREFAQMALELDPACFAKPCATPTIVPTPLAPVTMPVPVVPQLKAPPAPPLVLPMAEPQVPVEPHTRRVWRRMIDVLQSPSWAGATLPPVGFYEVESPVPYFGPAVFPMEKKVAAEEVTGRRRVTYGGAAMKVRAREAAPPPAVMPAPPVPPMMLQAIQEDLNRRLPPRFVAPQK